MCKECKCNGGACSTKKEESIIVKVDTGCDGEVLIKVWGITLEELDKELHTYNRLYQTDEFDDSFQSYLEEKEIKFEEFNPPVIDISGYEDEEEE